MESEVVAEHAERPHHIPAEDEPEGAPVPPADPLSPDPAVPLEPDPVAPLEQPAPDVVHGDPPPLTTRDEVSGDGSGEPLPPIDDALETKVKCGQCGTGAAWKGAITPEMLERTFTKGVTNNVPHCPRCGTVMTVLGQVLPFRSTADVISQAAEIIDAERAGQAAQPIYQPPIKGLFPPFDFRKSQLQIEGLERSAATAKAQWEEAKEEASSRKKAYDEAIDALCKHIERTKIARQEAEYEASKAAPTTDAPTSDAPAAARQRPPCITEQTLGVPCSVCRGGVVQSEDQRQRVSHLAAAAANSHIGGSLSPEALVGSVLGVTGIALTVADIGAWTTEDRLAVVLWLEKFGQADEPWTVAVPLPMGRFHEAAEASGEQQACRLCGAALKRFTTETPEAELAPFPVGQKVGLDCAGDGGVEPVRLTAKRHRTPKDAARAKQAAPPVGAEPQSPAPKARKPRGRK